MSAEPGSSRASHAHDACSQASTMGSSAAASTALTGRGGKIAERFRSNGVSDRYQENWGPRVSGSSWPAPDLSESPARDVSSAYRIAELLPQGA
jgi:hypothetical protein